MGKLRDTVRENFKPNRKNAPIPYWMPKMGLVVLLLFVAISLVRSWTSPELPPPVQTGGGGVVVGNTTTTTQQTNEEIPIAPPSEVTTPGGDVLEVELGDGRGGIVSVPDEAYRIAIAWVQETTGGGRLIDTRVRESTDSTVDFVVVWDRDGAGPLGREEFGVQTRRQDGSWQVS